MRPYRTFRLHWDRGWTAGGRRVMHHRIAGPLLLLLTLLLAPEAWGATVRYVSKSGTDNSACTQAAPCGTIQHAVNIASAGDTISIGKGKFSEDHGVSIAKDLTINGAGPFGTRVGANWGGVFQVGPGVTVTITGLDVMGGNSYFGTGGGYGGGIYNRGNLTLQYVRVWKNYAEYSGGGIFNNNDGTLFMYRSEIAHNSAGHTGGGLHNQGLTLLSEVRIVNNDASYAGGISTTGEGSGDFAFSLYAWGSEISYNDGNEGSGIENRSRMALINTTVSRNDQAGIYAGDGSYTKLTHVTVAENGGGGLQGQPGSTVDLYNTIVANNAGAQCREANGGAGTVGAIGSLIGDFTCGIQWGGNLVGIDPWLGPLKANGGYTHTHALKAGSPAIDAGQPGFCEPVDQRGVSRQIGGNCDIGAFEYQPKGTVDQ